MAHVAIFCPLTQTHTKHKCSVLCFLIGSDLSQVRCEVALPGFQFLRVQVCSVPDLGIRV